MDNLTLRGGAAAPTKPPAPPVDFWWSTLLYASVAFLAIAGGVLALAMVATVGDELVRSGDANDVTNPAMLQVARAAASFDIGPLSDSAAHPASATF
jgi:hypothetical protein